MGPRTRPPPAAPALPAPSSSDDDAPPLPADAVEVARVLGAWGVKGAIRVKPLSADPQALFSSRRWFIRPPEVTVPTRSTAALPQLLRITQVREQGETIVATCQELADRDAAQALAGASVLISRASFPTPSDDEFYWVDLIGVTVRDRQRRVLGTVVGLIETGPHCVLRIQGDGADAAEVLVPFVDAYVDRVDLAARTIDVDWHDDY